MINMALHGEGEPFPTYIQKATQAATIALFEQWQTYRNGVHMDWDTFRSINFEAIAVQVLAAAGFEVKSLDVPALRTVSGGNLDSVTLAGTTKSNPFSEKVKS